MTTKQQMVIDYYRAHPDARTAEVAERLGVSVPTVSAAKKKAGLTRTSGKTSGAGSRPAAKAAAAKAAATTDADSYEDVDDGPATTSTPSSSVEMLRHAIELAGGYTVLLELIAAIDGAGGPDAIRQQYQQYQELGRIFGD